MMPSSRLIGCVWIRLSGVLMAIGAIGLPEVASAHGSVGSGFMSGFFHPVSGYDHLLAMVAVGLLSAQMGGRALWTVPAAFVGVMFVGGLFGLNGFAFPAIETGIVLSVIFLGVAIALERKLPLVWAMEAVGFFALFHGYAHGIEVPHLDRPWPFVVGFLTMTALLHIVGLVIGHTLQLMPHGRVVLRTLGGAVAVLGFALFIPLTQAAFETCRGLGWSCPVQALLVSR